MNDAVVVMAYGSPSGPEDVRPYLEDVRGGRPISDEAVAELAERYRRIGGRSPLDDVTEAQRAALERELGLPVFVGMKHWRPRIAEAVEAALAAGATRVVGLASSWLRSSAASGERAGKPASWIVLKLNSGARLSAKPQPGSVTAAPRRRRRRIRRRC